MWGEGSRPQPWSLIQINKALGSWTYQWGLDSSVHFSMIISTCNGQDPISHGASLTVLGHMDTQTPLICVMAQRGPRVSSSGLP